VSDAGFLSAEEMIVHVGGARTKAELPPGDRPKSNGFDNSNHSTIDPAVNDALSAITWANLDIPPEERLLGDVITTSTRSFLIGNTGIGKTILTYGMVAGMATGQGFLQWTCDRPSKWLIFDGEMPSNLIKARITDTIRRVGGANAIPPNNLTIYARDRQEQFAKDFPNLGRISPLNTEAGHTFVMDLIDAIGDLDGVAFDNLMSLAPGNQKDEEIWAGCIPLVEQLSRRGIAQLWDDHSGWQAGRQYGTSTKGWRFDNVIGLTPLVEGEQPADHLAFRLSFDPPGKARRRTPQNWKEFAPQTVRLVDDTWSHESVEQSAKSDTTSAGPKLRDKNVIMLEVLTKAIKLHGRIQNPEIDVAECPCVARSILRERLISAGWFAEDQLCTALHGEETKTITTDKGDSAMSNALITLRRKKLVGYTRFLVWLT
jgi:hypothetical protein